MRALIVEDEFTSRMQLKYFLEEHGAVDIAVNGEEALCAIDLAYKGNKPYQLICLDVKMPGMDGNELLQKIREIEDKRETAPADRAKIFMATGVVDPKSVLKSFYQLCDEYLEKPVDNVKLFALLKKYSLI
jgi:two-component system, chemotaxis family, chemotaxis protein CheY